jgi:hypothetical protein
MMDWSLRLIGPSKIGFVASLLSNGEKMAALKHYASVHYDYEPRLLKEFEFLTAHFSTCSENRNILLHSRADYEDKQPALLNLRKPPREFREEHLQFKIKLVHLHRIADEMWIGAAYAYELSRFASLYIRPPKYVHYQVPAWPQRPRTPRKLNPHQQPIILASGSPQPEASGE